MHDLILVCVPPPHVTGTSMPIAFFLRQGVEMVDQGDQPPLMLMALCTAREGQGQRNSDSDTRDREAHREGVRGCRSNI